MTDRPVTVADLEAIGDVLDWLTEQSDQLTVEQAITLNEALAGVEAKVKMARSLLETQAKTLLDGQPIKVGDTVYVEKATGKWRPDQDKIKGLIVSRSKYDANGVKKRTIDDAIRNAVDIMYMLFVSPSQMPKQGGMKLLHVTNEDVANFERTGSEIKKVAT